MPERVPRAGIGYVGPQRREVVGAALVPGTTAPAGGIGPGSPAVHAEGFDVRPGSGSGGGSRKARWRGAMLSSRVAALASRGGSAGRVHFVSASFRLQEGAGTPLETQVGRRGGDTMT